MSAELQLISSSFLNTYNQQSTIDWNVSMAKLQTKANHSKEDFEYNIVASSLFSSKIEGNSLDFNSFYNNRSQKNTPKSKEIEEIENLASAYQFASDNILTSSNFLEAHRILSATLLKPAEQGKYRKDQIGVRDTATGRPVYLAVEPKFVEQEMTKLFSDISSLIQPELRPQEVFYYASMIHLWIAMIHPFADGNGRAARLLEKWFLASKLGNGAWSITSEKYYWEHRGDYYLNIALGYNYYALHWERCFPFLLMLPGSIKIIQLIHNTTVIRFDTLGRNCDADELSYYPIFS